MQDQLYFKNRKEAGKELAVRLSKYVGEDTIILALPRGGVVVAYEVARALHVKMEVIVARKIGAPGNPEFGIGAIAEGDVLILNTEVLRQLQIPREEVDKVAAKEISEMERRISMYRENRPLPSLEKKTVILVDDGLATGVTAQAALTAIDRLGADTVIFAAPVCSYYSSEVLRELVDDIVCILRPFDLMAIGSYYHEFDQVSDEMVKKLIKEVKRNE